MPHDFLYFLLLALLQLYKVFYAQCFVAIA